MTTGKGRRLAAAVAALMTGLLAACGSSSSTATQAPATDTGAATTTSSAPASTQGTQTSSADDVRHLDPLVFPEQDTPLAQANDQLKQLWAPYRNTIIPSRHTLETMQTPRKVANLTVGALDDDTAQSFLNAEYRDNTFVAWAERVVQLSFLDKLEEDIFQRSPVYQAVKAGQSVADPACDLYPVNPAVVVLDQATKDFFAKGNFTLRGPYALVQTYIGPCDVTLASPPAGATPLGSLGAAGETDVIAGHLVHDPLLGDLWFADATFDCSTPGVPQTVCVAART